MKRISKILFWYYYHTTKQTLSGRNRDRRRPELGRMTIEDIKLIFDEFLRHYKILKQKAPSEKTLGARIMLNNGIMSLALYRALGKVAVGEDYVTELCTDIFWKSYIKSISVQRFIARFLSRDPQQQMVIIQKMFLRFPLAKPGYDWNIREMGEGYAYDITRCPVWDYFKSQGPSEITFFKNSWCTLDFPLAEHLVKGGRYTRNHTLSAGDGLCDMCWKAIR